VKSIRVNTNICLKSDTNEKEPKISNAVLLLIAYPAVSFNICTPLRHLCTFADLKNKLDDAVLPFSQFKIEEN
jgi:peroxiredoxin